MAVEAARDAVRGGVPLDALLFATTSPAYAEKLDAATIQAALDLPESVASVQLGGSTRAPALGALLLGLDLAAARPAGAGVRQRRRRRRARRRAREPGRRRRRGVRHRRRRRGDRAPRRPRLDAPWRSSTSGACPRSASPSSGRSASPPTPWRRRSPRPRQRALEARRRRAGDADDGDPRRHQPAHAWRVCRKALGLKPEQIADTLAASVGRAGAAHAGLLLARALDRRQPGDRILVVCEADGADALVLEVTEHDQGACAPVRTGRPLDRVQAQRPRLQHLPQVARHPALRAAAPPRSGAPGGAADAPRTSAGSWRSSARAAPSADAGHLPPQRVCVKCGAVDQMREERYADTSCRSRHLHRSTTWPTRCSRRWWRRSSTTRAAAASRCRADRRRPEGGAIGNHLEMTFRRLFTAQGVHNYFWKARPAAVGEASSSCNA